MLLDGFDLKIQNIPYFDQSVAYDMLADLFTKIVATSQDKRLSVRFYNDCMIIG